MKKLSMAVAVMAAMVWSASWLSACDNCGCKPKAEVAKTDAKGAVVATETAVKCVACPLAQPAEAGKPAVKCPGDCKAGCCKGDATKCATCPAAKTCKAAAAATDAKTCGAAAKTCGAAAAKGCGYVLPAAEPKADVWAKDAK
jgi:hypothetical protein